MWSLWINLGLIRLLVVLLQEWIGPTDGNDYGDLWPWVFLAALCLHFILFIWQATGTIRASEASIRDGGAMASVWGAQFAVILAFLWTVTYAIDAWQMTVEVPDRMGDQLKIEADRAKNYSISPTPDGQTLLLTGSLELGINREFLAQLAANPAVTRVVLHSVGGNIYEARGLSQTIRATGLSTVVIAECSSACTTVFIGGSKRQLGLQAKLGFHQYRIDAAYPVLNANPQLEQERDRAVFLQAGVAPWFIDKMYDSLSSEIWYPEMTELLAANAVTEVASE